MNNFLKLCAAAVLCAAVASPALAHGGDRNGGEASHASRSHVRTARPRAPKAPRLSRGERVRPTGNRRPPSAHFDLRPAPGRAAARPGAHGGYGRVVGRAGARGWGAPNHGSIVDSKGFAGRMLAHQSAERRVNHVYWHTDGGQRYAHWYDGKADWYGFYNGPRFYWTRYDDNRWWWFDQTASRWLYWNNGYWWWNNPDNAADMYVVVGDSYYPYAEVAADASLAPGAAPDDSSSAMGAVAVSGKGVHGNFSKVSPDGTRRVQVFGARREAFLYDLTGGADPRFIAFLAAGVKHVSFSEAGGPDLQVMLLMLDGSYNVYDANGRSVLPATGNGASATPGVPGTDAVPADSSSDATDGAPPSLPPSIPAQ